ncbi:MAG: hypothetical protein IKQ97_06745, partial [Eubacterium sp.]|nr:hypothetical protein [Eubacterium sp.]
PYYLSVFPPASLPSLADATASTRSGALQDGENILRKWSRYLMSAALACRWPTSAALESLAGRRIILRKMD